MGVLGEALASVPGDVPVIVVDNEGLDASAQLAEAAGATVIRNTRNVGFGAACNQGAVLVRTPLVLFLNPDARLSPGSLERMVGELTSVPGIAATGPVLARSGHVDLPRCNSLLDIHCEPGFSTLPKTATDVRFLSGAAMLVRTDVFRQIGGFDERIFLYLEDDDLCFRLRRQGHRLRLVTDAVVAHERTPAAEVPARILRRQNRSTFMSMRYLAEKYGVSFDFARKRRQAWKRLLLAALLMDRRRIHANLGRLQGLGVLPSRGNAARQSTTGYGVFGLRR
ncbi:MAG: glycosyltransferase family 2 protein [Pseudomonadota bacterium]